MCAEGLHICISEQLCIDDDNSRGPFVAVCRLPATKPVYHAVSPIFQPTTTTKNRKHEDKINSNNAQTLFIIFLIIQFFVLGGETNS